jgi:hypothetical protein
MQKKYRVELTQQERDELQQLTKSVKGSSQKGRHANIPMMADAKGPAWPDARIAQAYRCRVQTVESLLRRLVTQGLAIALHGQLRSRPPRAKILAGNQEAIVIALRLGPPPPGYGRCSFAWSPSGSWNWKSWSRSAMKRCVARLKKTG